MSRQFTRRQIAVLLAGAAASLAACSNRSSRTLRIGFGPLNQRAVQERIAKVFEAQHPGVSVELDGSRTFEELAQRTMRGAIVDDLPDLAFQGNANIRLLRDRGLTVGLDEFIGEDPTWSTAGYVRELQDFGRLAGETVALPFYLSTPVVFYNLKLVKMAGGDPENLPASWDGILALAQRIRATTRPDTLSVFYDYAASNGWGFQSMLFSLGGRMTTEDESAPAFGGREGAATMSLIAALHRAGQIDISREQALQAFAAGALGIFFSNCGYLPTLRLQAGDRFGVGIRPLPVDPVRGHVPAGGSSAVILAKDQNRRKLAWEYIRFALQPEVQTLLSQRSGSVPVNGIAITSPRYLAEYYAKDEGAAVSIKQIPQLTRWYAFPGPNSIRIYDGIKQHVQEVITGRVAPDIALAEMIQETQALMPPFR